MKWNAKNRIYVLLAVVVTSCIAFYFFGFTYLKEGIQAGSDKYIELKKNSILLQTKGEALRSLEGQYNAILKEVPRISKTTLSPTQEDILEFLVQVEGLEQRAGVRISTTIRDPEMDPHIQLMVFPFDVKIYGSYGNVYKFLTYLESLPQTVRIEKVELLKNESTEFYIGDVAVTGNATDIEMIVAAKILSSVPASPKNAEAGQKRIPDISSEE